MTADLRRSTVLAGYEEPRGPAPRPPEAWLRVRYARAETMMGAELAYRLAVEVVVETPGGHAYLGRVVRAGGRWALRVTGRDRLLRLPAGTRFGTLGEHSWSERQAVIQRQRAGEPGAVIARGQGRSAAS
ncbi:MAG TPA: hypothetical protein PLU22_17180 [Polyangiaceae bacterium]|nr:hypothetical protein [Polyangiaceae bacterium]